MCASRRLVIAGLAVTFIAAIPLALHAATKEKEQAAAGLVEEALSREIYGLGSEREKLLAEAAALAPESEAVKWQQGQVRYFNRWVNAGEVAKLASTYRPLVAYQRERTKAADTGAGQLALANWCAKNRLTEQERAHLTRVVELDSENSEARARLGFAKVQGQWVSADELEATADKAEANQAAFTKWKDKVEEIAQGLQANSKLRRDYAAKQLLAIGDPAAIPALETVLADDSPAAASLVVQALDKMSHPDAALALARLAIYSNFEEARRAAAQALHSRPLDDYVPSLLASLYTPVTVRTELFRGPGGRLMHEQVMTREGKDENQVLVLGTAYRRQAQAGGNRNETLTRALASVALQSTRRERSVAEQNEYTSMLNERILVALKTVTEKEVLPETPQAWWEWWNEHNELFVAGPKTTTTLAYTSDVTISDRPQFSTSGSGGSNTLDCLAAGTPVMTASGLVPIDRIRLGDLVLSQNVETGELAYKPVLRTTVRPKSQLVRLEAGAQYVETSGGHLFFVAGNGWMKAREIRSGMALHTPQGGRGVSTVDRGQTAETYNLVVADFHTYFAGHEQLLCHDNTLRHPTRAIVPGLVEK